MLAQQLYEGVELGEEGAVGLITYMRTDSVRVAAEAQEEAREWVTGRLGREYLPDAPPTYKAKKSAQEAHEAIRPSSVAREPKAVARFLTKDQLALYRLIWERFLASQMHARGLRHGGRGHHRGGRPLPGPGPDHEVPGLHRGVRRESREAADETPEDEAESGDAAADEGEVAHAARASIPSSTSPSRRRASPRPRWSSCWRSGGSGGRPPTRQILGTIINDRGYVRRERGTLFPTELGIAGHRHAGAALPRDHGRRVHRPDGGVARQDRGGRRGLGRRRSRTFYKPFSARPEAAGKKMGNVKVGVDAGRGVPRVRQAAAREVGALRQVPRLLRLSRTASSPRT